MDCECVHVKPIWLVISVFYFQYLFYQSLDLSDSDYTTLCIAP